MNDNACNQPKKTKIRLTNKVWLSFLFVFLFLIFLWNAVFGASSLWYYIRTVKIS